MNTISFMSANFVAREIHYHMNEGWMQGQNATIAYFQPLETYAERFGAMLAEVHALGFQAIDLWLAHIGPDWATPDHIAIAKELLQAHGLTPISLAGGFGNSPAEVEQTCRLAQALGATVLGGGTGLLETDRPALVDLLRGYGLRFGLENHPEKSPHEVLACLGSGAEDVIGVAADTGWFGTQGYDAAQALTELKGRLFHVHLKDVLAAGGHETCRFGRGVVPVERCVQVLKAQGYQGALSIEHEPEHFDPREDVQASAAMVRTWWSS